MMAHCTMRRFVTITLMLLCCSFAAERTSAQYYSWGVDPAGYRWRQIKGDKYRIIYPDSAQNIASRMTQYLDAVSPDISYGYKLPQMSIPFVVHPENICSNGLVMWLPKRVEFLSAPSIYSYSMPWLKQLISHEYRHAVQYNNLNRGLVKILSYILGQQSSTIGLLFMSQWMMEGDAVMLETEMSTYGRGLQPSFTMAYRAYHDVANRYKNLDKWFCGSYKEYIPDHYVMGYLLCRHSYNRFGTSIGGDIADLMARRPYMVVSNTWAFRRLYGISQPELFDNTFNELKEHWESLPKVTETGEEVDIPTPKSYTTYSHPMPHNGKVVALKSNLDTPTAFVAIDTLSGHEHRIAYTGAVSTRPAIDASGRVWWTEYRRSALFEQKVTSQLCYMELDKGRPRRASQRQNILYPTPINEEDMAWVEYQSNGQYSIVVNRNSEELYRTDVAIGSEVHGMAWDNLTEALYIIITDDEGMHIAKVSNEHIEPITKSAYTTLSDLRAADGRLYFGSIASGRDELHYYDLHTAREYRISESKYGSFNPMPIDSTHLLATRYDQRGYLPTTESIEQADEVEYAPHPPQLLLPESRRWNVVNLDTVRFTPSVAKEIEERRPSRRFSRIAHAFNVHSWAPASYDPYAIMEESHISFNLGATIMSQNILSTMEGFLTWGWNHSEGSVFKGTLRYKGLGVNLWVNGTYGGSQQIYRASVYNPETGKTEYSSTPDIGRYYSISAGAALPILMHHGYHTRQLTLSSYWVFSNGKVANVDELMFDGGKISNIKTIGYTEGVHQLSMGIQFQDYVAMSHRDFLPPWGVVLSGSYTLNPTSENMGHLAVLYGKLYTPGFAKHHSLNIAASYQTSLGGFHSDEVLTELTFKSTRLLPRGFSSYDIENNNYVAASLNYQLPIWYPDGGWQGVIYFKRIRLNVGCDYASFHKSSFNSEGSVVGERKHLGSYGGDIGVDFNIFGMPSSATLSATFSLYRKVSTDPNTNGKMFYAVGFGLPF